MQIMYTLNIPQMQCPSGVAGKLMFKTGAVSRINLRLERKHLRTRKKFPFPALPSLCAVLTRLPLNHTMIVDLFSFST